MYARTHAENTNRDYPTQCFRCNLQSIFTCQFSFLGRHHISPSYRSGNLDRCQPISVPTPNDKSTHISNTTITETTKTIKYGRYNQNKKKDNNNKAISTKEKHLYNWINNFALFSFLWGIF